MKTILLALAATTAISSAAIAGNPAPVELPAIAPVAAAVTDWSGPYVGASFSLNSGYMDYYDDGELTVYDGIEGEHYGVFAGYNMQRGAMVFGGEIAYSMGDLNWPEEYPDDIIENLLDLKARVGFATGNVLLYGVAAYTMGHYDEGGIDSIDATGFSYGVGAEMKFGEHMFAGVEYLARDIGGAYDSDDSYEGDFLLDTIQIRAGWQF